MYTPAPNKPLWQPSQILPFWSEVAQSLKHPNTSYNDLPPSAQLTAAMAYLVLSADWGEYGIYNWAEQEMQRFLRGYQSNYLDLTVSTLPPTAKLVYNLLNKRYCQVFYGRDTHPDDEN